MSSADTAQTVSPSSGTPPGRSMRGMSLGRENLSTAASVRPFTSSEAGRSDSTADHTLRVSAPAAAETATVSAAFAAA